jgi:predicted RND superfamily exporter protein
VERLEARFGHWVLRHRVWVILGCLALVLLAGSGGERLSFTNNYRVFFSEDNPQLLAFEALENTYVKNDNVLFVVAPRDGNAFARHTLAAVEYLTERAWQIPYSTRVDSVGNFQHTSAVGDDLLVRDLVEGAARLDADGLASVRDVALGEPLLLDRLVSAREHVTGVNVTVQLPGLDETAEIPAVAGAVRALAAEVETRFPGHRVYLTGMVMMNNAFSESSILDMKTLVPVSFLVMALALLALTRGFAGTAATLLVVLLTIVFAMGAGGWVGFPITPPSATAPTIILTVTIANCVHVLVTYLQRMGEGDDRNTALVESLRVNLQPVFLASLTTAFGFLSMNFSEVPPFRHLGTFVAFGVGAAFVLSVTFLPALVSLLPSRVPARRAAGDRLMSAAGEFVVRRRRVLLWAGVAVTVALVASVPRNELNDVFVNYFDESVEFRSHADFTVDNLTGLYHLEYSLHAGESGGISEPGFLADLAEFVTWFRAQPEVIHVNAVSDVFARLNRNMHGDDPAWHRLPESRELAAQYLLLYEMSLPYGLDLNNQLDVDKSSTRVTVTTRTLSSNEVIALDRRAQAWLQANARSVASADGSGTTLMFANIGQRNIRSMLIGTSAALAGISLVLVFALRSLRLGLVSLIPNLVPGAMGFGLWGLLVGEVGLSLSVVTSMTLGIVVDDTVHFLSKYQRARRELGYGATDSVRYAFATVGRALVITSVVLVAGFLVLSLSSFELNSGMGLLTAIVIGFALLADLLLLPPLLMKMEGTLDESNVADAAAAGRAPA